MNRRAERGHLMAGLMVGVTIMLILSSVAFQAWSDVLRRDNEAEMMFRAQDLVRAIQRYRKDHGGMGPLKLEQLMEEGPKGQYYLRHLWEDPLVKDGKWGLLHVGPGGQIIDPNAPVDAGGIGGLSGGLGGGLGGGGFGGNRPGGQNRNQTMNRSQLSKGGGRGGLPGSPLNAADPSQLEGLPIAGVRTLCEEQPFRIYNGLTEYQEWLFTYLDLELRAMPGQGKNNRQLNPAPGQGLQQTGPGRRPGQGSGGFPQSGSGAQPSFPQPGQQPGVRPGQGPGRR